MHPTSLGHSLSSHPLIREVHNSFSKSSPFSLDPSAHPEREKEDAYHFVTYLPVNDVLYELDGLRQSPIMHAAIEGEWLDQARETIETRIATYPPGSVSIA
jgi:ubiquitin carboxyl-terminal hydrolase L5